MALAPDGTVRQPGRVNLVDIVGGGSKVPDSTKQSGNRPAGVPPKRSGSRVPARPTVTPK
jgi:hypothetical protein